MSTPARTLIACLMLPLIAATGGCALPKAFDGSETANDTRALTPPPPEMVGGPDDTPIAPRPRPRTAPPPPPLPRIELADAASAPVSAAQPAADTPATAIAEPMADARADVRRFLESWRKAWAGRDAEAYLAHYAPEFKGGNDSPESWRAGRKRVLGSGGALEIRLGTPDIRFDGADRADVVCEQYYRSEKLADVGTKRLSLVRRDGRWLIAGERFTALK
ncbi:nuclear transport factor 2 family protein [Azonexus sp. R2A61]|uniref:nuclear transport factor 2 family protein n=1 Tax=Azonexus sp. R2A61 TaxID=2744443 RepID=UPI001F3AF72C|nr:nuclear transport factor 2 family protein [Azonexus sp. R2A61]